MADTGMGDNKEVSILSNGETMGTELVELTGSISSIDVELVAYNILEDGNELIADSISDMDGLVISASMNELVTRSIVEVELTSSDEVMIDAIVDIELTSISAVDE